jgi:hypothetical protein
MLTLVFLRLTLLYQVPFENAKNFAEESARLLATRALNHDKHRRIIDVSSGFLRFHFNEEVLSRLSTFADLIVARYTGSSRARCMTPLPAGDVVTVALAKDGLLHAVPPLSLNDPFVFDLPIDEVHRAYVRGVNTDPCVVYEPRCSWYDTTQTHSGRSVQARHNRFCQSLLALPCFFTKILTLYSSLFLFFRLYL